MSGQEPGIPFWPTARNITGRLSFEWVFVGVSEKIVFRGVALALLARSFGRRFGVGRWSISSAGTVSAVLFGLAHGVGFERSSFLAITFDPSWFQVGWAFVLGIYYAALCERTGSLLGAILSHNISDGLWLSFSLVAVAII